MKNLITSMQALATLAALGGNQERYANATGSAGGMVPYTGQGDPTLAIPGQIKNFAVEGHINHQVSFTIKNTAMAAREVVLFPGYNLGNQDVRPGQMTDGEFYDRNGQVGLQAYSTNARVKLIEILQFFKENPTRVVQMRIQTNKDEQLLNTIELQRLDIFKAQGSDTITPSTYIGSNSFNTNIVTFDTDFQIDDRSDILTTIAPDSTTTYTLFCGATLDKSQELAVKAAIGKQGAQMLY
ncbi:hypothetical protein GCM10023185_13250 [Hymenobacter saemangeumensis]|uniref:Uncharacterized protein n=1 Tax=Hymenobacter saemangeumensis TaxID=1084522 RepID=A0ABP8I7I4_9BACT